MFYNLCQCYFEENKIYGYSYLFALLQYSRRIVPIVPKSVIRYNIVEITATQRYTRIVQNRFPEQQMLENDRMETVSTEVTPI